MVLPKPSTMPEPPLAPNGLDEDDVPESSRSEEWPTERRPIPLSQFATLVQKNRYTDVFYEEFHVSISLLLVSYSGFLLRLFLLNIHMLAMVLKA